VKKKCLVIGGGILGLSVAYKLLRMGSDFEVTLIEKEPALGRHQTGNNSGVLHAGLYYRPGSAKAILAVSGIRQMKEFCAENGVKHETCGKLVVAVDPSEVARLEDLHARGVANGLSGLRRLGSREEIREIEPHAAGIAAIHVPDEGIVDYSEVCSVLAQKITRMGGSIELGVECLTALRRGDEWIVRARDSEFSANEVINCAGLHSDRVCRIFGGRPTIRIVPFRGEYFHLSASSKHLVRNLIYPVPDPHFPFLGVHFTRMIRGGVEAGPNAVLAFSREGYRRRDFNLRDSVDSLFFPGLWAFIGRHPKECGYEWARSISKSLFLRSLQRLVPEIEASGLLPGGAGVRAQAMDSAGQIVQDFEFQRTDGVLHVLNAPSPGATAALAIADHILKMSTLLNKPAEVF
jgi:L-2-hydroxyglutarate oxidase